MHVRGMTGGSGKPGIMAVYGGGGGEQRATGMGLQGEIAGTKGGFSRNWEK